MKPLTLLPLITIAIFLTSCDAVFTGNHITDSTTDLLREELTGAWQAEDGVIQIEFDEDISCSALEKQLLDIMGNNKIF